jgi:hypothetical protein
MGGRATSVSAGAVMSDQDDWDFAGDDNAKMTIRAAVRYLIKGATGGARGDIVQGIISIVRQAVHDLPDQPDPFDDDAPGG